MQDTGFDYNAGGVSLPITRDNDGDLYLYDPNHLINTPHYAPRGTPGIQMQGLGITTDQGVQLASQAANFIPVVGQYLSAALQIGDAIFGGGDPTPLSQLISQIVQARGSIADANRSMGIADTFVIPSGFNPQDKAKNGAFVDGIVTEVIGANESDIQANRRKDYYSTISALGDALKTAQGAAHDQGLTSSVESTLLPVLQRQQQELDALGASSGSNVIPFPTSATDTTSPVTTTVSAPLTTTDYLMIAGGVGILLVIAYRAM